MGSQVRRHAAPAIAVIVCVIATGCGGSSSSRSGTASSSAVDSAAGATSTTPSVSADEADYVAAFEVLVEGSAPERTGAADVRCAATGMLESITVERLVDLGISPEQIEASADFSELASKPDHAEARAMLDPWFDCVDIGGVMAGVVAGDLASALNSPLLADPEVVACFADRVGSTEAMREFATSMFIGEEPERESYLRGIARPLGLCVDWGTVLSGSLSSVIGHELDAATVRCIDATVVPEDYADLMVALVVERIDTGEISGDLGAALGRRDGPSVFDCLSAQEIEILEAAGLL